MNPDEIAAIQEAKRRMTGQPASGAGFTGGAQQANAMMPTQNLSSTAQQPNPVAQYAQGGQPVSMPPTPMQRFANPNLSDQTQALETGKPDQTTMVLKSLTKFLDKMTTPQGV